MSVNTYAKIKETTKGYVLTINDADAGGLVDYAILPTLKKAIKEFREWNKQGWIEYGLQDIELKK